MPVSIFYDNDHLERAVRIRLQSSHRYNAEDRVGMDMVGTDFDPHSAYNMQVLRRAERRMDEAVARILGEAMNEILEGAYERTRQPWSAGNIAPAQPVPPILVTPYVQTMTPPVQMPVYPKAKSPPAKQKGRLVSLD